MKKKLSSFLLLSLFGGIALLSSCNKKKDDKKPEEEPSGEDLVVVDSEAAMNNFLAKVDNLDYSIRCEDYVTISAHSNNLIDINFDDDGSFTDFGYITVNHETFRTRYRDNAISSMDFLGIDDASEAANDILLNSWMDYDVSEGNIWNLFYNDPDNPLTFTSHDESVIELIMKYSNINELNKQRIQNIYLTLDAEDPTECRVTADIADGLTPIDPIDLVITFGNSPTNSVAEEWMNNQNRQYPAARTEWGDDYKFVLDSVFISGYGEAAVPFPTFASYAFIINEGDFVSTEEARIKDFHATQQDLQDYAQLLLDNGFSPVMNEQNTYRKLLRAEYSCYSNVKLEYDNGVSIIANRYYDMPSYDNLTDINSLVTSKGFIELPNYSSIKSYDALDRTNKEIEGFLYLFNYDLYLYIDIEYDNYDALMDDLTSYGNTLVQNGYQICYINEDDPTLGIDRYEYESPLGIMSFRYHIFEDGRVTLLFKSEKYISPSDTMTQLENKHFITFDSNYIISSKDIALFQNVEFKENYKNYYSVTLDFDTQEARDTFLTSYILQMSPDEGYTMELPEDCGINWLFAFYNPTYDIIVGFEVDTESNKVNFIFVVL